MPGFEVTISLEGKRLVVAPSGECDLAERAAFAAVLADSVDRCLVVVVDLAELSFIDSSGINELVAAHHAARRRNGHLYVRNAFGMVAGVLAITGVSELLALPDDADSATGDPR